MAISLGAVYPMTSWPNQLVFLSSTCWIFRQESRDQAAGLHGVDSRFDRRICAPCFTCYLKHIETYWNCVKWNILPRSLLRILLTLCKMWHTFTAWGPSVTRCRSKRCRKMSDGAFSWPISQLLRKQRELNRRVRWKYLEISGNCCLLVICLIYLIYLICLSMATFQDRHWSLWKPHPHRCQLELDAKGRPARLRRRISRVSDVGCPKPKCWLSKATATVFISKIRISPLSPRAFIFF